MECTEELFIFISRLSSKIAKRLITFILIVQKYSGSMPISISGGGGTGRTLVVKELIDFVELCIIFVVEVVEELLPSNRGSSFEVGFEFLWGILVSIFVLAALGSRDLVILLINGFDVSLILQVVLGERIIRHDTGDVTFLFLFLARLGLASGEVGPSFPRKTVIVPILI